MAGVSATRGHGYDLGRFGLRQMIESSRALRQLGAGSDCMEGAACELVDFFFESFRIEPAGEPACALVRCFKTHRFGELPPDLREVAAAGLHGGRPEEAMMCLTLLATRGLRPEWNTRHGSAGHKAIPLATGMIEQAPMIARLLEQVGLETRDVLETLPGSATEHERRTLDVFHVEEARGSPFVPAQAEFVEPYGVRSVLGFGGMLPTGELFFVLLFSRVAITRGTAGLFRTLALAAKLVLLRHDFGRIFAD